MTPDKILPNAADIENLLIGTVLVFQDTIDETLMILRPEYFYIEKNRIIYQGIQTMRRAFKPIDQFTLHKFITAGGANKEITIDDLTRPMRMIVSSSSVEYHARVITEKYMLRKMIADAHYIIEKCYASEDPFVVSEQVEKNISQIKECLMSKDFEFDNSTFADRVLARIMEPKTNGLTGINTGVDKLNDYMGGWNSPDLIILAGRPGMGKTTRMLEFMKRALNEKKHCVLFSLEMSHEQLAQKFYSNYAKVSAEKFRNNGISPVDGTKLRDAAHWYKGLNLFVCDKAGVNINYMRTVLRERKKKHGLDMVFVDYLQIIGKTENVRGRSMEQDIAEISTGLKNLAKDLQVPIMALAQLSRESEKRTDKRPVKSDLRHSGQIEQDADIIFGLYRPSHYGDYSQFAKEYNDPHLFHRISELIILKNRHGESDRKLEEYFYGEYSRFEQLPMGDNTYYPPMPQGDSAAF